MMSDIAAILLYSLVLTTLSPLQQMLTNLQLRGVEPDTQPNRLSEAESLYLRIDPHGGRCWRFGDPIGSGHARPHATRVDDTGHLRSRPIGR
jgi:hypothetical protein